MLSTVRRCAGWLSLCAFALAVAGSRTSNAQVKPITVIACTNAPQIIIINTMPQIRPVPEVISNYGGSATAGNLYMEWTLGEPRIESVSKTDMLYTQGFHQPLVYTIPVKQTATDISVDNIKIVVYPNPVNDVLNVRIETAEIKPMVLELLDIFGRIMQHQNVNSGKGIIPVQMKGYISGSYVLVVRDADGQIIKTIKLIKLD